MNNQLWNQCFFVCFFVIVIKTMLFSLFYVVIMYVKNSVNKGVFKRLALLLGVFKNMLQKHMYFILKTT